uniref:Uncharacterized protein n=1 Tax=Mycena chlorophos TaxID=658473 RepID=A0ABQ0L7H1_MYCCL|nr:predicted protein [Mycena chlorophos]
MKLKTCLLPLPTSAPAHRALSTQNVVQDRKAHWHAIFIEHLPRTRNPSESWTRTELVHRLRDHGRRRRSRRLLPLESPKPSRSRSAAASRHNRNRARYPPAGVPGRPVPMRKLQRPVPEPQALRRMWACLLLQLSLPVGKSSF